MNVSLEQYSLLCRRDERFFYFIEFYKLKKCETQEEALSILAVVFFGPFFTPLPSTTKDNGAPFSQ
jgi:hypothetical protein